MEGVSSPSSVCLILLFVVACDAVQGLAQKQLGAGAEITGYSDGKRNARSITKVARFILQSLEKWQKILDKATPERPIGKVRQFSTRGDYNKAVADFESLNPLDVTEFIIPAVNGKGMRGRIGDVTYTVRNKGPGGQLTIVAMQKDLFNGSDRIKRLAVLTYTD